VGTNTDSKKGVGRPTLFSERAILYVNSAEAKSKLQANSERRAVFNCIVEHGGKTTLEALNKHFGYNVRSVVIALIDVGWVSLEGSK